MENKALDVTNMEEVKEKVSDVKVYGNPGKWICVGKASSERQGWMKSTKVVVMAGGLLVQTSTQQKNEDGSYALADALAFVPGGTLADFTE